MSKGEKIILKDDKGKQYELIRVLDLDTEKIINDLSALVVKKDKIIDEIILYIIRHNYFDTTEFDKNIIPTIENVRKHFEERCK